MRNTSYFNSHQRLAVAPGHPIGGVGCQLLGVPLQFDQVVEGVGAAQLAGVDQRHEQIPDLCPVQGAIDMLGDLVTSSLPTRPDGNS